MKKIVLILTLLTTVITHAQTDGLSYQAVIIDSNVQELPWQDATGNILPNEVITLRFSILDFRCDPSFVIFSCYYNF